MSDSKENMELQDADELDPPKIIAVVGNAIPTKDHSEEIDSADSIVRFNACDHFTGGKIGTRTDILSIRSFGRIGKKFAEGIDRLDNSVANNCGLFWFVGEAGQWREKIADRYGISTKPQRQFNVVEMQSVDRLLNTYGSQPNKGASLGTMTIQFILSDPAFQDAYLKLYCFGFEGWKGHPWKLEKRFAMFCQFRDVLDMNTTTTLSELIPELDSKFVLAEDAGEYHLAPAKNHPGEPVPMNNTGRIIVEKMEMGLNFGEICSAVGREYPDAPDNIDFEIASFLWEMEDMALLYWR